MELSIEKLRKIDGRDSIPNPNKKIHSPSDLNLHSLSITAPLVPVTADVAEDDYFSDEDREKKKPVAEPEGNIKIVDMVDKNWHLSAFTVHVDGHRILTLSTSLHDVALRWLKEVRRCFRGKKGSDEIIVGVSVAAEFEECRDADEVIRLCIGSQCLLYELPERDDYDYKKCALREFFADRRVVAAGVHMSVVAKKLLENHGIQVLNVLDLNEFAVDVLANGYKLDLKNYDLDRVAMAVLGKWWYVERPEFKLLNYRGCWYYKNWCEHQFPERVKYATYDAYTSYMIGIKLLEMKSEKKSAASAGKKSIKKKVSGDVVQIRSLIWAIC